MLIDMHTHIGGAKVGFIMTEDMILQEMEKYHVDYCIVSNGDSAEFGHDLKALPEEFQMSQTESFLRAIRFARKNPGKIGVMPSSIRSFAIGGFLYPASRTIFSGSNIRSFS